MQGRFLPSSCRRSNIFLFGSKYGHSLPKPAKCRCLGGRCAAAGPEARLLQSEESQLKKT